MQLLLLQIIRVLHPGKSLLVPTNNQGGMQSAGADKGPESLTPDKRPQAEQDGLALYAKRIAAEGAPVPDDVGPTADEWASTDDEDDEKEAPKGGAASRSAAVPGPPPSGEAFVSVEGFEAAASFLGVRDGKCFKVGAAGLGYYPDCIPDSISLEALMQSLSASAQPEAGSSQAAAPPSTAAPAPAPIATPNFAEIKSRFSRARDPTFSTSMYANALKEEEKLGPGVPLQLGSRDLD